MERRFKRRVWKIEKQINEEMRKLEEERIEAEAQARFHAAAVAAIVLHGEPKIDEPLERAWLRALKRYGIHVSDPASEDTLAIVGPHLVANVLKPGAHESDTFSEIFQRCTSVADIVHFSKVRCEVAEFRATQPK
jgi:hypothetical protein